MSSAVCQMKNGGAAGVTSASSEVSRRSSGVASSPSRIRRRSIGLRLHRRDRVAQDGEVDRLAPIRSGASAGQPRQMAACGEADEPDAVSAAARGAGGSPGAARRAGTGCRTFRVSEDARANAEPRRATRRSARPRARRASRSRRPEDQDVAHRRCLLGPDRLTNGIHPRLSRYAPRIQSSAIEPHSSAPSSDAKWPVSRSASRLFGRCRCRYSALAGGTSWSRSPAMICTGVRISGSRSRRAARAAG